VSERDEFVTRVVLRNGYYGLVSERMNSLLRGLFSETVNTGLVSERNEFVTTGLFSETVTTVGVGTNEFVTTGLFSETVTTGWCRNE
jgi:hypothetical protein